MILYKIAKNLLQRGHGTDLVQLTQEAIHHRQKNGQFFTLPTPKSTNI